MEIPFYNPGPQLKKDRKAIDKAIASIIDRQYFASDEQVSSFENEFASYCKSSYFSACANGTDALELIFRALDINNGDEVIVPAFSCWATVEPLLLLGIKPVFVDISEETLNINSDLIQSAITPKTRAILTVNLYGNASDLKALKTVSKQNDLFLIEDCAQAHGAKLGKKFLGTYGHAAAFSFYPTKNLGALGEAGGVLTGDKKLAEKIRQFRDHGQESKDTHLFPGRNSRMDEIQAGILRVRLNSLDHWNEKRRENAQIYRHYLKGLVGLPEFHKGSNFHLFPILLDDRDGLSAFLQEKGIGTAIHYPYILPAIANKKSLGFPVAKRVSESVLSLPIWPGLTRKQIEYVAGCIISYIEG